MPSLSLWGWEEVGRWQTWQKFCKCMEIACENSRPSSLPAEVAFRETPLGPGAKKDGCFCRLAWRKPSPIFLQRRLLIDCTQSLILVNKIHFTFSLVLALHCHYHCCSTMKKQLSSFSLSTEDIWYVSYF